MGTEASVQLQLRTLTSLLVLTVCLGWMGSALAGKPAPSPPGNHLIITKVEVVVVEDSVSSTTTLTIFGAHFSFGNSLEVTLGEIGPPTSPLLYSDNEIVAEWDSAIANGDYLLTVSTGNGQSKNDEYDLTIGAGGGAQGPPGEDGADGSSCSIAGTTVSCTDGTSADVQGPPGNDGTDGKDGKDGKDGADGAQGPIGPEGPEGPAGPSFESANKGGDQPHNNMQPFLAVHCIIFIDSTGIGTNFPLGEIRFYAGIGNQGPPPGWAFCDGQIIPVSQNPALFSILGAVYGGDGRSTFGLPDARGRVLVHEGSGPGLTPRRWGEKSGAETHTLITNEIPSHNHNP